MSSALSRHPVVPARPRRGQRATVALLASLLVASCTGQPSTVRLDVSGLRAAGLTAGYTIDKVQVVVTPVSDTTKIVATVDVDRATDTFEVTVPAGELSFTLNAYRMAGNEDVPVFIGQTNAVLEAGTVVDLEIPAYAVGTVSPTLALPSATLPAGATLTLTAANAPTWFKNPVTVADQGAALVLAGSVTLSGSVTTGGKTYALVGPTTLTVAAGDLLTPKVWFAEAGTKCAASSPAELVAMAPLCRKLNVKVSGLEGTGLVVSAAGSQVSPTTNTTYTFANGAADGEGYGVRVEANPPHQLCTADTVTATGVVAGADVTVNVTCVSMRQVSAVVTGLAGAGLSVTLASTNPTETLDVDLDGTYPFATRIVEGGAYTVAVASQPPGQLCTADVANAIGLVGKTDVTVNIVCATLYYARVSVIGLVGGGLSLQFSAGTAVENADFSVDGTRQFTTPLTNGMGYNVSVTAQPTSPHQNCVAVPGIGTVAGVDPVITVTCTTFLRPAAVHLAGMLPWDVGPAVTLTVGTGGNPVSETLNNLVGTGAATFSAPFTKQFTEGQPYTASFGNQPSTTDGAGQCLIANAAGVIPAGTLTINVYCVGPVAPAFHTAPNWTDYVIAATPPAQTIPDVGVVAPATVAAACDQTVPGYYSACVHGGEVRAVQVTDVGSCAGVTATDSLGAFAWTCSVNPNGGVVLTSALAPGKGLADLVDTTVLAFRTNAVTVFDGTRNRVTPLASWWSNIVDTRTNFVNNGGTATHYVLVLSPPADNNLFMSPIPLHTSVLVPPGQTIDTFSAMLTLGWVEGQFTSTGQFATALSVSGTRSVLRNVTVTASQGYGLSVNSTGSLVENATIQDTLSGGISVGSGSITINGARILRPQSTGLTVMSTTGAFLSNVEVQNALGTGVSVSGAGAVKLDNIRASGNSGSGVTVGWGCNGSAVSNVQSWNNTGNGLEIQSNDVTVRTAVLANNGLHGLSDYDGTTYNCHLFDVTAFNNDSHGLYLGMAANWTLAQVTSFANGAVATGGSGIQASNMRGSVLTGITVGMNATSGIDLGAGNLLQNAVAFGELVGINAGNTFRARNLALGKNTLGLRFAGASTASIAGAQVYHDNVTLCDLVGATCAAAGLSLVDVPGGPTEFAGPLATNDTINTSDTLGTSTYDAPLTDWTHFETLRRGWGLDAGTGFPLGPNVRCIPATTCRIFDWRLLRTGDLFRAAARADGTTATHTWYMPFTTPTQADCNTYAPGSLINGTVCESTYFVDVMELPGYTPGNGNGLCEVGETCVNPVNVGADQGTNALVAAPNSISGVTLWDYNNLGLP